MARQFFLAGAAAGTIAKTMSAYDMKFSDAIYGVQQDGRYVSKGRVKAMMEQEFDLVVDRVGDIRSKSSRYFAYAATVAAKSFNRKNECHAWCGVRVQMYPGAKPSNITVHVRMFDDNAEAQQQALGVLGVNLIYAAYHYFENPKQIIDSLTDGMKANRIEIDSSILKARTLKMLIIELKIFTLFVAGKPVPSCLDLMAVWRCLLRCYTKRTFSPFEALSPSHQIKCRYDRAGAKLLFCATWG